jgi:hypothetical protein
MVPGVGVDHAVVTLLLLSLSAVGLWALVTASPLGRIPCKPFNCQTCLCGWGSIMATEVWALYVEPIPPLHAIIYAFAATGLSRVTVAVIECLKANSVHRLPPALDLGPPPVVQEENDGE